MILGFNIGRSGELSLRQTISIYKELGCNALEISLGEADDLERLHRIKELTPEDLEPFEHLSLHAPAGKMIYGKNELTKQVLADLQELYERLSFKHAIIHPDRVEDWQVFEDCSFPVVTENMDHRKEMCRTVQDLKELFSKVNLPMVLDLNHCYVNDNSMKLATDMYEAFGHRIVQIHLSGFKELHDPLFETNQVEIIKALPNKELPIIIESPVRSEEAIRAEYEYVLSNLL